MDRDLSEAKDLIEMLDLASRAGWKGKARMARDGEGALQVHRRSVELSERESKMRARAAGG